MGQSLGKPGSTRIEHGDLQLVHRSRRAHVRQHGIAARTSLAWMSEVDTEQSTSPNLSRSGRSLLQGQLVPAGHDPVQYFANVLRAWIARGACGLSHWRSPGADVRG